MPDNEQVNPWMQAASGTAQGAAGAIIGLATGGIENKRQRKQQRKLNDIQFDAHKKFTEFNSKEQLKMWEATNYKAQMEQLKKAGLNPALIYEGGGPGGTTQVATGGEAAPTAQGRSDAMAGMGMALQQGMMQAQIELMKAQTEKTRVDAAKTAGVDTENTQADTAQKKINTRLGEIQAEIQGESTKALKYIITGEAEKLFQEVNIMRNEGIISQNTWSQKIDMVTQELIGMTLENEMKKSNIEVNKAQIQKWSQELQNAAKGLQLDERNTKVNEKLAEFNTSLSREALGAIGGIVSTIISKGMTKGTVINKHNMTINRNQ